MADLRPIGDGGIDAPVEAHLVPYREPIFTRLRPVPLATDRTPLADLAPYAAVALLEAPVEEAVDDGVDVPTIGELEAIVGPLDEATVALDQSTVALDAATEVDPVYALLAKSSTDVADELVETEVVHGVFGAEVDVADDLVEIEVEALVDDPWSSLRTGDEVVGDDAVPTDPWGSLRTDETAPAQAARSSIANDASDLFVPESEVASPAATQNFDRVVAADELAVTFEFAPDNDVAPDDITNQYDRIASLNDATDLAAETATLEAAHALVSEPDNEQAAPSWFELLADEFEAPVAPSASAPDITIPATMPESDLVAERPNAGDVPAPEVRVNYLLDLPWLDDSGEGGWSTGDEQHNQNLADQAAEDAAALAAPIRQATPVAPAADRDEPAAVDHASTYSAPLDEAPPIVSSDVMAAPFAPLARRRSLAELMAQRAESVAADDAVASETPVAEVAEEVEEALVTNGSDEEDEDERHKREEEDDEEEDDVDPDIDPDALPPVPDIAFSDMSSLYLTDDNEMPSRRLGADGRDSDDGKKPKKKRFGRH